MSAEPAVPDCTCHMIVKASPWRHAEGCAYRAFDETEQDALLEAQDAADRERKERGLNRHCGFDTPSGGAEVARRRQ